MLEDFPISSGVLDSKELIRSRFQSQLPLQDFVVLKSFLPGRLAWSIYKEICTSKFSTWCGYSKTGDPDDLESGFIDPNEEWSFVTVHERPLEKIDGLDEFADSFTDPLVLKHLSNLTGLDIESRLSTGSEILTRWRAGHFIAPHTDAGTTDKPTKLVISIALTQNWDESFGGSTHFTWGGKQEVVWPLFNSAVLFRPHTESVHWVQEIACETAPDRYNFTMHFR